MNECSISLVLESRVGNMMSETSHPIIRSISQVFVVGTEEQSYCSVVQYVWNDLDCVPETFCIPLIGFEEVIEACYSHLRSSLLRD